MFDLKTPTMTDDDPAPGRRVRQVAPEFAGTHVHHTLYLPADWKPGGRYPVVVEYTGNLHPPSGTTGEVKDANLGFGLTGRAGFIWVVMPCVEQGGQTNALTWWGDRQATIDYCKTNVPRVCEQFAGDPGNVVLCGFSRGAIATSYLGLADDEIASLWKGIYTHDHVDGQRPWPYPDSDRESALTRLARLRGRPMLVTGNTEALPASLMHDSFLKNHLDLARFTFLDLPMDELFDIPEGPVIHPHTDRWMHEPSRYRDQARAWLAEVTGAATGSVA